ncbi:hypothetical protein QUF61_12560 [Candidatus Venteria ishoeyi]|uniref:hypothetical protein n=1 Tax=Candidatus Venteria ishoeyi TaxID=1899563 RepID=UPI0025A51013|nr:hypothetical protein [Candidatus Venteria ishoeyi]MDM8547321.1 hypothetical protein [Candidatus Venteria ishoeyi]
MGVHYSKCPACGAVRDSDDDSPKDRCPACGIVFKQWLKSRLQEEQRRQERKIRFRKLPNAVISKSPSRLVSLLETLFYVKPQPDRLIWSGQLLLYVLFLIWGWQFLNMPMTSNQVGNSFMHNINLVFHEAGHVIFMLLGDFMHVLGGSLGQLIMPLIILFALLIKNHDTFGASIALWWLGQSLMDLAPYINDARAGQLMLLGGVTGMDAPDYHDWHNLLERLGWLAYDHGIARFVDSMGVILMLLAFLWGALILYLEYKR